MSTKSTTKSVASKSSTKTVAAKSKGKKAAVETASASAFEPVESIVAIAEVASEVTSTDLVLAAPTDLVVVEEPEVFEPSVEEVPEAEAQVAELVAETLDSHPVTGSTDIYPKYAASLQQSMAKVSAIVYDRITEWLASSETRFRCVEESNVIWKKHKLTTLEYTMSLSAWCQDSRLVGMPGTNAPFIGRHGGLYRPGFQPKS